MWTPVRQAETEPHPTGPPLGFVMQRAGEPHRHGGVDPLRLGTPIVPVPRTRPGG
jgi:hypothetical protein